jgi:3-oxoacyl-[acyl-carrier protein] reductase
MRTVVVTGRRSEILEQTAKELGDNVRPVVCDGTDAQQVASAVSAYPAQIDVLVNHAGGNTDFDRSDSDDLHGVAAAWHANLDANLTSAVIMTEAVRGRLRPGGTVVNIGSIAADTTLRP